LRDGIRSIGYNDEDTEVMKDAMMWAQLRNNNQGIIKLTSGGLAKSSDAQPSIENESPVGARINGNQAMSMVVLERGVRLAIEKAKANNIGVVGTYNTSQSCGALGFYTEKIASQGLIGIIMATSPEFVAPFGAKQPILGTNPIACGVPTDQGLMLMDQATAAFPWFGLLEAKTAGIQIPEGVAYDADGHPTRDPNAALKGALRTFDRGYKSSNLALMVELLAGPLVGAAHMNKLAAKNWGNLVIAVHPAMLGDPKTFYKSAGEVLQRVQNADKLPGVKEIIIPGSKEAVLAQSRVDAGAVPLEKNMLGELRAMAANYGGVRSAQGSAGADRQLQLLEQLVSRLDKIEQSVAATQQQQHQLSRQQERLETVTAESLRGMNGMGGSR
jgi:LDH2 family malate/lactate/ureidoglycolate dehydrogenase